jgi:hypothetical protein
MRNDEILIANLEREDVGENVGDKYKSKYKLQSKFQNNKSWLLKRDRTFPLLLVSR